MATQSFHLVWDDVVFDTDCLRIRPERIRHILRPIPFKGAMSSLNAIKGDYFQKKYDKPFKLVFVDSAFSGTHSPAWAELTDLIEKAIEISRFVPVPKTVKRKPVAKPAREAASEQPKREPHQKPDYLRVLARLQHNDYKLITIQEKYGGRTEESHLYRLPTGSGRVLIVWENTNASRAAYLFIATAETMHDRLARIEAFIHADGLAFKRSRFQRLKENKALRTDLHFVDSVHHDSPAQFEVELRTFMNWY